MSIIKRDANRRHGFASEFLIFQSLSIRLISSSTSSYLHSYLLACIHTCLRCYDGIKKVCFFFSSPSPSCLLVGIIIIVAECKKGRMNISDREIKERVYGRCSVCCFTPAPFLVINFLLIFILFPKGFFSFFSTSSLLL